MEHTQAGGCLSLKTNDLAEWENGLTQILSDDKLWGDLAQQAATRELTTWADSAAEIRRQLD
jgi:hypothetical protein